MLQSRRQQISYLLLSLTAVAYMYLSMLLIFNFYYSFMSVFLYFVYNFILNKICREVGGVLTPLRILKIQNKSYSPVQPEA